MSRLEFEKVVDQLVQKNPRELIRKKGLMNFFLSKLKHVL